MTEENRPNPSAARPTLRLTETGATFEPEPVPEPGPVLVVQPSQGMFAPPPPEPEGELRIIPFATRAAMIARNPERAIRPGLVAGRVRPGTLFRD